MDWIEHHPGLAAWVQAVGSLIAVGAAAFIAIWQTNDARNANLRAAVAHLRSSRESASVVIATVAKFVASFTSAIGDKANLDSLPHIRSVDSALEVYRDTIAALPLADLQDGVLCERVLVVQSYILSILDMLENLRTYLKRGGSAREEISARVDFIAKGGASVVQAANEFQQRLTLLAAGRHQNLRLEHPAFSDQATAPKADQHPRPGTEQAISRGCNCRELPRGADGKKLYAIEKGCPIHA